MIITDDTPPSPSKNAQPLPGDQNHSDTNPAPPAYTGYQQGQAYPGPVPSGSGYVPIIDAEPLPEPAGKRFFKAFGVALVIYFLLVVFTGSAIDVGQSHRRRLHRVDPNVPATLPEGPPEDSPQIPPQIPLPLPVPGEKYGKVIRCASGTAERFPSEPFRTVTFELPLSADVLYIFSRGSLARGSITFVEEEGAHADRVHVDVSLLVGPTEPRDATNVCLLERQEGQTGIGILTPSMVGPYDPLQFYVTVRFPRSSEQHLNVSAFETDLPLFSHHISSLDGKIAFKSLNLKSTNARIVAESLYAESANIKTTNGAIQGNFRTSGHLSLVTTNAPIQVYAHLTHDNVREESTETAMITTNGAITASVRMSSPDSTGGAFKVSTQTSNGPVHVHFVDSPVDTYLDFSARTSNAPAGASLHRAYEGSFSLHTTHKAPVLHISEHAEDPSGRARGRNVTSSRWRSGLEGSVAWGNPPYDQPLGSASVQSTNSAVTLELQ